MLASEDLIHKILEWLKATGTTSLVLLGAAFSFNAGVAILKRLREELNRRLKKAIHAKCNQARDAGWLGHLENLEQVSSPGFKEAARKLMAERDSLDARPLPFVVWSSGLAKMAMLLCAAVALVCMTIPHTARWTVLLFGPYPVFATIATVYEKGKLGTFNKLTNNVKKEFDKLSEADKRLVTSGRCLKAAVDKKIMSAPKKKVKSFGSDSN